MPVFSYTAINSDRQSVTGTLEADSMQAAREQLEANGLTELQLEIVPAARSSRSDSSASKEVNVLFDEQNVEELGESFAALTRAGLPLEAGLRMMAEEHPSRKVASAMRSLSRQLESGKSWSEVSASAGKQFPPAYSQLFDLKLPADRFSALLSQYLAIQQYALRRSRRIWSGLLYTQIVMLALATALLLLFGNLVPKTKAIFEGFDTELPQISITMIQLGDLVSESWRWIILILAALGLASLFGPRSVRRIRQQIGYQIPFSGRCFQANSMATFCALFSEFIRHRVPLSDAVRLAASGSGDLSLEDDSRWIGQRLDQGMSLTDAAMPSLAITEPVLTTFHRELQPEAFADNLDYVGEMYSQQAEDGAELLPVVAEPFLVFFTLFVVGILALGLLLPLVKLLNDLS